MTALAAHNTPPPKPESVALGEQQQRPLPIRSPSWLFVDSCTIRLWRCHEGTPEYFWVLGGRVTHDRDQDPGSWRLAGDQSCRSSSVPIPLPSILSSSRLEAILFVEEKGKRK